MEINIEKVIDEILDCNCIDADGTSADHDCGAQADKLRAFLEEIQRKPKD